MQTFLPYPSFSRSAQILDNKRLGKQRVEVLQILNTLAKGPRDAHGKITPWYNHPAVQMWKGHEGQLRVYGYWVIKEWLSRGYNDTCRIKLKAMELDLTAPPTWFGDERLHLSHRSNLKRKDPKYYGPKFESELSPDLPYFWPSKCSEY